MTVRLPAALEVAGMLRMVEAAGGFGMVLHRGDADAGAILLVLAEKGENQRLYERISNLDGKLVWHCTRPASDDDAAFANQLARRAAADPDLWIVELDVADAERLIG